MTSNLLLLLGLGLLVAAAFLVGLVVGLAVAGVIVIFLSLALSDGKGLRS